MYVSASFGKARWRILLTCLMLTCDGNVEKELPNRPRLLFYAYFLHKI